MSSWCALFFVQTCLVETRRVDQHRRLGILGAALALLVVTVGAYVTVLATKREVDHNFMGPFHYLLGINFVNLAVFGVLVVAGLTLRNRPQFHKRLMLLATISILAPAIARIMLLFTRNGMVQFVGFYFCVLACVVADTIRNRRLHPAIGWGALLIVVSFHATFYAVQTELWMNIVTTIFSRK